ncbi:relaxase/mobilization nuclease domain-containing protein [Planosporangium sp. 12N6]|uniref:relaxase/mobilization nuclease domain-containing protein n=1 Tax=Planosporangium spinosum TaxID=3402278 RepID=UPI003CF93E44
MSKGRRVRGLLEYLWGPGRRDEHENPRIVAGYDLPEVLAPPQHATDPARWDLTVLAAKLDAPQVAAGERGLRKYVWHCPLSLPPYEQALDDATWGRIAHRFVELMGFAGDEQRAGCRWIAVHHGKSVGGNDHVHLVVTLATEEGAPVWLRRDWQRSQEACEQIETEFGLGKWVRRDKAVARPATTEAEVERGYRQQRDPDRLILRRQVRAAAIGAHSEAEWVARMRASGLLVNPYRDPRDPDRVVGYGVAREHQPKGERVWFNARTLDGELSLRRMRQRWPDVTPLTYREWKEAAEAPARAVRALADAERMTLWRSSTAALSQVTARMAQVPAGSPEWAAIARASADVLTRVALVAEPSGAGPVSKAADALARAAAPRRAEPPPVASQIAADLGRVADALMVAGSARRADEAAMVLAVVVAAARLVSQLAELRRAQERVHAAGAAQAAAARLVPLLERATRQGVLVGTAPMPGQDRTEAAPMERPVRPPTAVDRPGQDRRDERDGAR